MTESLGVEEPVLRVTPLYEGRGKSIAHIVLHGVNRRSVNHGSWTQYEVLCGEGGMDVDGTQYELGPGSVVEVPMGTPYHDWGDLAMRATSWPPFDPDMIEFID